MELTDVNCDIFLIDTFLPIFLQCKYRLAETIVEGVCPVRG